MGKVENLGKLVRDARKNQGLTQGHLAISTGVGVRFIQDLERGKESCHIGKTLLVLDRLGISIQVNGTPL